MIHKDIRLPRYNSVITNLTLEKLDKLCVCDH